MKTIVALLSLALAISSCTKSGLDLHPPAMTKDPPFAPTPIFRPRPQLPCIDSYQALINWLGGPKVSISAVILEDDTYIQVGGIVTGINYSAAETAEGNSLFRSNLEVVHRYWGYEQSYWQSTWSLGCRLAHLGTGTLTNLSKGSATLTINAGMVWSVPPHENFGKRIKLLILKQ